MKKMIKAVLVCFLALGLAACSKKEEHGLSAKNPVVITIWHYYNGAQLEEFDALVKEFNESVGMEKGIVVEAFNRGSINDLSKAVEDSLEGKVGSDKLPNAFATYADTAYEIDKAGMAVDIGKYLTADEIAEYEDAYIDEGRFPTEDQIKLFPIAKSTEVFAINTTYWNEFAAATGATDASFATWEGIAKTAEEYYKWTDSLTEEPEDGKAFFGRDAFANYMIIGSMQLGHEIFTTDGDKVTIDFDKATMKRLWDNYYIPYINGYYAAYGKFRSDDVKTGDLLAFVGSTSGVTYFPTTVTTEDGTSSAIENDIYPLPNFEGTQPYAVQQGAGMLVLKSEEKKEYATIEFLKWFTQTDINLSFAANSGYLPVKKDARDGQKLEQFFSDDMDQESTTLKKCLDIGLDVIGNYELYTTKPFKSGTEARAVLNTSMQQKAQDDRAKVEEAIAGGKTREEAVKPFASDENFEQWYDDTYNKLKAFGE